MNPWTWLENHPNAALTTIIAGSILLVFFAAWIIHWYVVDARYWPLVGHLRSWRTMRFPRVDDEWDEEWRREPSTDADAAAMTAEWHTDPPGPVSDGPATRTYPMFADASTSRAGGLHLEPWHERGWWDDPDLTVWDAKQQAARCWEILHIEFPRLRAELGIAA